MEIREEAFWGKFKYQQFYGVRGETLPKNRVKVGQGGLPKRVVVF
jgi:hypothetical protein